MLGLFNAGRGDEDPSAVRFAHGLRRARLDQILTDPDYRHWFARAFAGTDD